MLHFCCHRFVLCFLWFWGRSSLFVVTVVSRSLDLPLSFGSFGVGIGGLEMQKNRKAEQLHKHPHPSGLWFDSCSGRLRGCCISAK